MELAVATGVPAREWMTDPTAMITAAEVLEEVAEKTKTGRGR